MNDEEKDIYLLAMWAVSTFGADAATVMAARAQRLALAGQADDAEMWRRVARAAEKVIESSGQS